MRAKPSFQLQFLLSVVAALCLGYLLGGPAWTAPTQTPTVSGTSEQQVTPQPFMNLTSVWMVRVRLHKNSTPEVLEVKPLQKGRITSTQGGESNLRLLDADGKLLFMLPFHTQFSIADTGKKVDQVDQLFIIPSIAAEKTLVITTTQGEVRYEFPAAK